MRPLHDLEAVAAVKRVFAPDGGAEREHNAARDGLGFGALHHSFVLNLRPQRVLVIGSRYGFVPAVIGLALQANGVGELDFVDANYSDSKDGFEQAYGGVGFWQPPGQSTFAGAGLQDIVHLHIMRSEHFFATCKQRYDYVYLDGNHSYEGCRYDFNEATRRTTAGATITLHDVLVDQADFGVGRFFDELDPARFGKLLIRHWPGLGVVQTKESA
jgi:hypothetical protein